MGALCLGGVQRPTGDLLHSFITLDIIESSSHRVIEPSGHWIIASLSHWVIESLGHRVIEPLDH
jgi:hypothetical protein